jgi:hypothetical protein
MTHRDNLDKWVSTENLARCRKRLADPSFAAVHVQYQDMLDRELAKIKAEFPT